MIPIRDAIGSNRFPVINLLIIILNVIAFLWELLQGSNLEQAFFLYGIVPARYSNPGLSADLTTVQQLIPFLASMFLHGGFFHLLGNMWFLYVFGDNIEDRLGHIRYFIFYIFCGMSSGIIHLVTNWNSEIPTIGASGAISGVMGAYLILYPRAKILTLIPIFFFFQFIELPAFFFLGYWFLIQLLSAGLTPGDVGGVAFWAHIGGFVTGLVFVKVFDAIPRTDLGRELSEHTRRRSTPRLQSLLPRKQPDELDLRGTICITSKEARYGTRKLISIPRGSRKKTLQVTIPPGIGEGTLLRLKGLGPVDAAGDLGDLLLEVIVKDYS